MKDKKNNIDKRSFKTYQIRLTVENIIKSVLFAVFCSFSFATLSSFLFWIVNLKKWWVVIILSIGVLIAAFFIGFKKLFKNKDENIAVRVDKLGLEDRVVTMVQYKDSDSLIAKLQRQDAEVKIKTVEPKKVKFSLPLFIIIPTIASVVIGLGSVIFVPERKAKAEPLPTAYTITFNSNGGTFNTEFLFNNDFPEVDVEKIEVKDENGEVIRVDEIITFNTEFSHNKKKNIAPRYFANNKGIDYKGYSLIGWNNVLQNDNGTEVTWTLDYMANGLDVTEDTTFYAIWTSIDKIIEDLLDDLRDIVNNADIDPALKDELLAEIDKFEEEILSSDLENQEKINKTIEFRDKILGIIEEALKKLEEENKDASDILIEGGKEIGSEALEDLGEAIQNGDKEAINDALDKIIEETKDLNDQELKDKLDEITGVIDEAKDKVKNADDTQLDEALGNLSAGLKEAGDQAIKGENEEAHETIQDAVDQAKDELGMIVGEKDNIGDVKEEIKDVIEEAIGKLEGQTGQPTETPNEPENPEENSGSGEMSTANSGMTSGNSGENSGLTSGNSGPTSNHNSGLTSGNSGLTSGNSGENSGLTSGNSGPTSNHNSGLTSGNSGMTSGNSGMTSGNSGMTSGNEGDGNNPDNSEKEYDKVIDGETPYKDVLSGSKEEIYAKLENGEIPEEYVEIVKNYLESLENE